MYHLGPGLCHSAIKSDLHHKYYRPNFHQQNQAVVLIHFDLRWDRVDTLWKDINLKNQQTQIMTTCSSDNPPTPKWIYQKINNIWNLFPLPLHILSQYLLCALQGPIPFPLSMHEDMQKSPLQFYPISWKIYAFHAMQPVPLPQCLIWNTDILMYYLNIL